MTTCYLARMVHAQKLENKEKYVKTTGMMTTTTTPTSTIIETEKSNDERIGATGGIDNDFSTAYQTRYGKRVHLSNDTECLNGYDARPLRIPTSLARTMTNWCQKCATEMQLKAIINCKK